MYIGTLDTWQMVRHNQYLDTSVGKIFKLGLFKKGQEKRKGKEMESKGERKEKKEKRARAWICNQCLTDEKHRYGHPHYQSLILPPGGSKD